MGRGVAEIEFDIAADDVLYGDLLPGRLKPPCSLVLVEVSSCEQGFKVTQISLLPLGLKIGAF
jgi:hypothetical protein